MSDNAYALFSNTLTELHYQYARAHHDVQGEINRQLVDFVKNVKATNEMRANKEEA
jgi:hypothetical protein